MKDNECACEQERRGLNQSIAVGKGRPLRERERERRNWEDFVSCGKKVCNVQLGFGANGDPSFFGDEFEGEGGSWGGDTWFGWMNDGR